MPIRVRVKRGSFPVNDEGAKKLRTTNVPCTIRVKSEIVNTADDVITVRTETGVDGKSGESFWIFWIYIIENILS